MNFSLFTFPFGAMRDDDADEWLGGDAWVTPQPFGSDGFGVIDATRKVDPANDWVPL